jgi:hypothetical protein
MAHPDMGYIPVNQQQRMANPLGRMADPEALTKGMMSALAVSEEPRV